MGVKYDPTCRGHHDDEETVVLIFCKCEAYSAYKFEHLGRHHLEPWELYDNPVRCLLNFASATGLFRLKFGDSRIDHQSQCWVPSEPTQSFNVYNGFKVLLYTNNWSYSIIISKENSILTLKYGY